MDFNIEIPAIVNLANSGCWTDLIRINCSALRYDYLINIATLLAMVLLLKLFLLLKI